MGVPFLLIAMKIDSNAIAKLQRNGAVKPVLLAEKIDSERSRCNICQRRCAIAIGHTGFCGTIANIDGVLHTLIYGLISSAAADPIEKKPVFHYKPGSRVYSVGSIGCNFRCSFCQNWQIAYDEPLESGERECVFGIYPNDLIDIAKSHRCSGIAWTYNEPSIWLNYALDCAQAARNAGLYTVYVTNGFATPEALELVAPYLDVYRVDIKSYHDHFYQKFAGVQSAAGIRDCAELARVRYKMHVECVTNIVPGENDSEQEIELIANWICEKLGNDTPWHITRFFPHAKLGDKPPTPVETLVASVEIAKKCGLKFVYTGNVSLPEYENTTCPRCGSIAIRRSAYQTSIENIDADGRCKTDCEFLNVVM